MEWTSTKYDDRLSKERFIQEYVLACVQGGRAGTHSTLVDNAEEAWNKIKHKLEKA